jgi:(2Fe-2S) ferredoxin
VAARRYKIVVCRGPECGDRRNSRAVHGALEAAVALRGAGDRVELAWQSCFGRCRHGPNVLVQEVTGSRSTSRFLLATIPLGAGVSALYSGVTPGDACELVDEHVLCGKVVRHLVLQRTHPEGGTPPPDGERRAVREQPAVDTSGERGTGEPTPDRSSE